MREIVIPHDPSRGPVVAVRRMLVHSSISELEELGVYDRYRALIDQASLDRIRELIGPGWMPIELALEHYRACEDMQLSDSLIFDAGMRAGENMGKALLVAGAQNVAATKDRSPWPVIGAFSRMGRRMYEGGSAQYVKTGSNMLQIEHDRNPLFSFHYYRVAHDGFLRKSFSGLGVEIKQVDFSPYRTEEAQIEVRLSWR